MGNMLDEQEMFEDKEVDWDFLYECERDRKMEEQYEKLTEEQKDDLFKMEQVI